MIEEMFKDIDFTSIFDNIIELDKIIICICICIFINLFISIFRFIIFMYNLFIEFIISHLYVKGSDRK